MSKDQLEIPEFLRRKRSRRKVAQSTRVVESESAARVATRMERVQLTEFVRLAETPYEEAGFAIREGIIPRRWYEPKSEQEREKDVARLHMKIADKRLKEEMRAEKDARPERVHKYAGTVTLEDVMVRAGCTDAALAREAIRKARVAHERWHFAPEVLATAVAVVKNYVPGVTKAARRSSFVPSSRILWKGKNPKREGSPAFSRWELLKSHHGRTVAEFLAAGGNPTTLRNAVEKKHVKLEDGKVN